MYTIIGADQKEYGPVTGEQIRRWIIEGRVNGQTRARAEGRADWQTLSAFPEFADLLGAGAGPAAASPVSGAFPSAGAPSFGASGGREATLQRVKGPAIGLLVTGVINVLLGIWKLLTFVGSRSSMNLSGLEQIPDPQLQKMLENAMETAQGPLGIASAIFQFAVSALILAGAIRMLSLRNHGLAITASVLAVIPCITPCCGLITLPFGIWALVVLNKPEVKSHFG